MISYTHFYKYYLNHVHWVCVCIQSKCTVSRISNLELYKNTIETWEKIAKQKTNWILNRIKTTLTPNGQRFYCASCWGKKTNYQYQLNLRPAKIFIPIESFQSF